MRYAVTDPSFGLQIASDADRYTVCIRAAQDGRMYYASPDACVDCRNCVPGDSTDVDYPLKEIIDLVDR